MSARIINGKQLSFDCYRTWGSPWNGYAECYICGWKSRDYTSAWGRDCDGWPTLGFGWGEPFVYIAGFMHYIIHHWGRNNFAKIRRLYKSPEYRTYAKSWGLLGGIQ